MKYIIGILLLVITIGSILGYSKYYNMQNIINEQTTKISTIESANELNVETIDSLIREKREIQNTIKLLNTQRSIANKSRIDRDNIILQNDKLANNADETAPTIRDTILKIQEDRKYRRGLK